MNSLLGQALTSVEIIINLLVAGYVLSRNPKGLIHRAFFLFVSSIAFWSLGIFLIYLTGNFIFDKVILISGASTTFGLYLFARCFPFERKLPDHTFFISLPFFMLLATIPFGIYIQRIDISPEGIIQPTATALYPLYAAALAFYIILSITWLFKNYKRSSGLHRLQMKYIFLGATIFIVASFSFDVLLPLFKIYSFNFVGPFMSIAFVGCSAYAIVRHRLLDIRIVIQRGIIFSILLAFIVGTYLFLLLIFAHYFQAVTNITNLISAAITALIGILTVPAIDRYFRRITDKVFFKNKYDYSQALHELSEILNKNLELRDILHKTARKFKDLFKTDLVIFVLLPDCYVIQGTGDMVRIKNYYPHSLTLHLEAEQSALRCSEIERRLFNGRVDPDKRSVFLEIYEFAKQHGIEAIIPICSDRKLISAINLGAKLSGDPYTLEDLQLLNTFAYQAAVALEKAELFQKVKDYNKELEARVEERTRQMSTMQQDQQQMLIDITHGLQTPLTVVKSELDNLRKRMPNNKNLKAFERTVDDVSKFVYDLLTLAQLESVAGHFKKQRLNISELLSELVEYFGVLANEEHIGLTSAIGSGIYIFGNKSKLEELVMNLVSNAFKYSPKSKKRRSVFIGLKKREDGTAELIIEDAGIGISDKDLLHIFERFYRVQHGPRPNVKGTGLGLALCKKIVEGHGGTIGVESALGKGTKFIIRFKSGSRSAESSK